MFGHVFCSNTPKIPKFFLAASPHPDFSEIPRFQFEIPSLLWTTPTPRGSGLAQICGILESRNLEPYGQSGTGVFRIDPGARPPKSINVFCSLNLCHDEFEGISVKFG